MVHIFVNGAIEKPEVLLLLLFFLYCLFLERSLPPSVASLASGPDYPKSFVHIIMKD